MKIAGTGLLCLLLIGSGNTQAATEFGENIPTRLAKIFVGIGPTEAGMYSDITDEFPPFKLPAEFMVIGSIVRDTGDAVYLSTTLEDAEARLAIVQAFAAEGWQEIPFPRPPVTAGFIGGRNARAFPTMLCHDELANMQINTTQTADELLMTINHQDGAFVQVQPCSEMVANRQQSEARFQAYRDTTQQYLPRLELPLEASRSRQPGGTGSVSSGNNEAGAQTDLRIDWELGQVFDFFAAQIAAQGWTPEGNSLTALTAGGSWTRSPEPGINLLGLLSIVKKAENDYRLEFNLISLPIQIAN